MKNIAKLMLVILLAAQTQDIKASGGLSSTGQALVGIGAVSGVIAWMIYGGTDEFMEACNAGDVEKVRTHLKKRSKNLEKPCEYWNYIGNKLGGKTALLAASEAGKLEVVKLLLERGANTEARDYYGALPSNNYITSKDKAIPTFGFTALMLAAKKGHYDVVVELLKHNANASAVAHHRNKNDFYANEASLVVTTADRLATDTKIIDLLQSVIAHEVKPQNEKVLAEVTASRDAAKKSK